MKIQINCVSALSAEVNSQFHEKVKRPMPETMPRAVESLKVPFIVSLNLGWWPPVMLDAVALDAMFTVL